MLKEAGMLEWMYYMRPGDPADSYVPQEDPEVTLFPKAINNVLVREIPASEIQWWPAL